MTKEEYVAELNRKIEAAEEVIILLEPLQCLTTIAPGERRVYGLPKWVYSQVISEEAEIASAKISGYRELIKHYTLKINDADSVYKEAK